MDLVAASHGCKMKPIVETSPQAPKRPVVQDHDLPVLAVEENPRPKLDWESLLASGVQPALALGAERRRAGRR